MHINGEKIDFLVESAEIEDIAEELGEIAMQYSGSCMHAPDRIEFEPIDILAALTLIARALADLKEKVDRAGAATASR